MTGTSGANSIVMDARSGDHTEYLGFLDRDETDRYERLPSARRRAEYALGRTLTKSIVAGLMDIEIEKVTITIDDAGAPEINDTDLHVSISHTGGWVAASVSPRAIGLDIQTPVERLPRRALTDDEIQWIEQLPAGERTHMRAGLWAIKEARSKLSGGGLRFPLPAIEVPLTEQGGDGIVHWRWFRTGYVMGAIASEDLEDLAEPIESVRLDDPGSWLLA